MVIKRKETKEDAVTIEEVINRGSNTAIESIEADQRAESSESEARFTLRIPSSLMNRVDEARSSRVGKVSRNQWILEVINKAIK